MRESVAPQPTRSVGVEGARIHARIQRGAQRPAFYSPPGSGERTSRFSGWSGGWPQKNATSVSRFGLITCIAPPLRTRTTGSSSETLPDQSTGRAGSTGRAKSFSSSSRFGDQRNGVSVLEFARLTADIAQVGDRETFDRFRNGGNVRGLVGNDTSVRGFGEYQDKELAKTASDLDDQFHGGKHIVSLPGQVDFKQLSMTSADLQFLESRKFTVREICRFFGVPPSFVFDDSSNNYKSAEMANVAFLSNTLEPLLRNIESELQRKLFLPSQYGRKRVRFDRRGLYACDLDSRVKYQAATIAAGLYTVNEWRAEENKPAVEGGDKVLVSANLKGIDELTAAPAEPQNPETNEE